VIYLQATTRGDNQIKKEIYVGVKKACKFNLNTDYEFVFDHGYAGDTYGVNDIIDVFNATTSNRDPSSVHENWTGSCTIDTIIYQRKIDELD
jgi:Na+-transporting NADH:ubiquinone oxidoreductase subunit NqrF